MTEPTITDAGDRESQNIVSPDRIGSQLMGIDNDDVTQASTGEFTVKSRTQWQLVRRRFFRHRLAMASLTVFIGVVLLAYVGLPLWKYPYDMSGTLVDGGRPTLDVIPWLDGDGLMLGEHPFGQDTIGRDYFAVTLRGAQQSLVIAIVAGLVATVIGTVLGAIAGYYRGKSDTIIMRFVDVMFTIPLLLVAAVLGRRFGSSSIFVLAFIIALASWLTTSRIIRAEFMSLRE
jgi:peptide/nickel transport system permease protein